MIEAADVVVGLAWGDEAKGKITSHLAKTGEYDFVARWAGGNNAGHTVYIDGEKFATHLIPSGVFYGIPSIIGPGCVLHPVAFRKEMDYLNENGFNSYELVKVAPNCHIVQDEFIEFDKQNLAAKLGTTSKGIAPTYSAKAARTGILAKDILEKDLLWDGELHGTILCEGAQGVWLDIDHGNYPFVTSSNTLPYAACSIGFPPQKIRKVWGAAKAYDTRSGEDPLFPAELLDDPELRTIADLGKEFGVTTGRRRKVRWLDLDRLVSSINLTGTTHVVISKCDILLEAQTYKFYYSFGGEVQRLAGWESFGQFEARIKMAIFEACPLVEKIYFSYTPEGI
jgi:adenylosuccinate synthase